MKPQKREKAVPTERLAPSNITISPETVEHMKNCEAREWIARYRNKQKEVGKVAALTWWHGTIADIAKRRGQKGADDLKQRMNRIQNEKSGKG
jgi:hypothetical protein